MRRKIKKRWKQKRKKCRTSDDDDDSSEKSSGACLRPCWWSSSHVHGADDVNGDPSEKQCIAFISRRRRCDCTSTCCFPARLPAVCRLSTLCHIFAAHARARVCVRVGTVPICVVSDSWPAECECVCVNACAALTHGRPQAPPQNLWSGCASVCVLVRPKQHEYVAVGRVLVPCRRRYGAHTSYFTFSHYFHIRFGFVGFFSCVNITYI